MTEFGGSIMDQLAIDEVAQSFLRARQTGERLSALPERLKPNNFADSQIGRASCRERV